MYIWIKTMQFLWSLHCYKCGIIKILFSKLFNISCSWIRHLQFLTTIWVDMKTVAAVIKLCGFGCFMIIMLVEESLFSSHLNDCNCCVDCQQIEDCSTTISFSGMHLRVVSCIDRRTLLAVNKPYWYAVVEIQLIFESLQGLLVTRLSVAAYMYNPSQLWTSSFGIQINL